VESVLGPPDRITLEVLRARLVQLVKIRIDNGEFTERGLARVLGISQSQAHNVLKGARRLQMQLGDRILAKLGLSVMDLLNKDELDKALKLKTTEWRGQMTTEEQIESLKLDIDFEAWPNPKKPAGRSVAMPTPKDKTG
jgi:plasmid maintenance system antidote protein VapI